MKPAYLRGLGIWTPTCSGTEAWCHDARGEAAMQAEAKMLEGPLRRRASKLTRMSVEAFSQAAAAAGVDPQQVATIWGTAHGEHATAIKLLKMMCRNDGKVSPTHFHNSVHNTPSAYASISAGNESGTTTLTGGPELVASALLEAFCQLEGGVEEVAVIVADEPLEGPFARDDMKSPLALAFVMAAHPRGAMAKLDRFRRIDTPGIDWHPDFGGLYVSGGLGLLEAAWQGRTETVALELRTRNASAEPHSVWALDIEPCAAEATR